MTQTPDTTDGLRAALAASEERAAALKADVKQLNRAATDRSYMLDAVVQMLGPKGRKVWRIWQAQGLQRIHTSWAPGAAALSGEEIAEAHLKMEEAITTAVPIENIDSHLPTVSLEDLSRV